MNLKISGNILKLLISLLILNTFVFASIVEIYRTNGIDAVKKELDRLIQTKKYWSGFLKDNDVRFGYYESIDSVLVCNKNNKDLVLYKKDKKSFKKAFNSSIFVGKANGDKQVEGDLKTPIGVYNLTKKLTKVDTFYGPLALVTSYPNLYDKVKKKTGHGIWIHGLPIDEKRDDYTKGCVALDNTKLETLSAQIDHKKSVVLLSQDETKNITVDDISSIISQVYSWKDAWQTGDINKYLSFYDQEFRQVNGTNIRTFSQRKRRIFKSSGKKTINFTNINISPYANTNGKAIFKVVMDEDYKARSYKFVGEKELYIELKSDGSMSILTEG